MTVPSAPPPRRAVAGRAVARVLFGSWLALSVMQQMDRPGPGRRIDPTSMAIPNWRFFAPIPARHDYNVLHRHELADGTVTDWQEYHVSVERSLRHCVWHPRRRMEKALFDVASDLFRTSTEVTDRARIQLTIPYLALLNLVTHRVPCPPRATRLQFLVANSAGHDERIEPRMLFLSEWHRVRSDDRPVVGPMVGPAAPGDAAAVGVPADRTREAHA